MGKYMSQIIITFSIYGAIYIFTMNNITLFYISIEIYSYSIIFITMIGWRALNKEVKRITIIYMIINIIASIIIIIGIINILKETNSFNMKEIGTYIYYNKEIKINSILIIPFIIKLGSVPFQFIIIPLYSKVKDIITIFHTVIPKVVYISIIYIVIISSKEGSKDIIITTSIITIISIITMMIGSINGVNLIKIKEILGASSIYNGGLLLIGASNKGVFIIIMLYVINIIPILFIMFKRPEALGQITLKMLREYNKKYPKFSMMWVILVLSLIGVPPLGGFWYKLYIMINNIENITMMIFIIIGTTISGIYYLNIISQTLQGTRTEQVEGIVELGYVQRIIYSGMWIIVIFIYMYLPYINIILGAY